MKARDYQIKAVDDTFRLFDAGAKGVLNALATGMGKSAIAGFMAQRMDSFLFVVDREELAFQSQKTFQAITGRQVYLECGSEYKAYRTAPNAKCVVAMSQSMIRRKEAYKPDRFEYIFEDECFPAGTNVDGKSIETIKPGDFVRSFNHDQRCIELRKVVRVMRKPARSMVQIRLANGSCLPPSTASHPWFVRHEGQQQYEAAINVDNGCEVARCVNGQIARHSYGVQSLWLRDSVVNRHTSSVSSLQSKENWTCVLLRDLPRQMVFRERIKDYGKNKQEIRERQNEGKKSYGTSRRSPENGKCNERKRIQGERWKREGTDVASENTIRTHQQGVSRSCHGTRHCDKSSISESATLQTGHSNSINDGMRRGGWQQSLPTETARTGSQERSVFDWQRVAGVETIEPTSDGTFGGVCADGFVYNIEVEGNHNYFVNGYLVHNCHHSVSPTRTAIRDYFTGKRGVIGFSATPQRLDGKAAGMVYDQVAMKMSFLDGVDLGWLVPFKSRVVSCHDMDLRQFKGSSEYSDKELRKQIEKDAVIEHIARKTIAIADGRQTVIFARTVEQSQKIQQYLKSIGERATHVDGKMHRYMRRDRLHQFAERNFQFVCNCGLIEEGVDVPGIEVVSMAAPMRSTGRFMQRVGRGSRAVIELTGETPEDRRKQIAESEKPHFTVIDFIGQMDEHSAAMCFAGDLLAGDFDDETRKVAIRLATGKQNADMRAIIAEARDIVAHRKRKLTPAEEKAAARERYANKSRSAENRWGQMTLFHPFDVLRIDRRLPDVEVPKAEQYGRVLDASTNYLKDCRLRPQEINALTNAQRVYLAKLLRQRAETHGTYPQYRLIHSCGYDASNQNREQAAELAKRCQDAGYIRPAEDGPNQLYLAAQRGQSISSAKDFVFL